MSTKSPIFPMPEPHHFSDYGFDPQIDYFQVPHLPSSLFPLFFYFFLYFPILPFLSLYSRSWKKREGTREKLDPSTRSISSCRNPTPTTIWRSSRSGGGGETRSCSGNGSGWRRSGHATTIFRSLVGRFQGRCTAACWRPAAGAGRAPGRWRGRWVRVEKGRWIFRILVWESWIWSTGCRLLHCLFTWLLRWIESCFSHSTIVLPFLLFFGIVGFWGLGIFCSGCSGKGKRWKKTPFWSGFWVLGSF